MIVGVGISDFVPDCARTGSTINTALSEQSVRQLVLSVVKCFKRGEVVLDSALTLVLRRISGEKANFSRSLVRAIPCGAGVVGWPSFDDVAEDMAYRSKSMRLGMHFAVECVRSARNRVRPEGHSLWITIMIRALFAGFCVQPATSE
jgi:hypothetical protein